MMPLNEMVERCCAAYLRRPWFWLFVGFLASCLTLGLAIEVGSWTLGFPSTGLLILSIIVGIMKASD